MSLITNASLETDLRLATALDFEIQRILAETFSLESLGIHTVVGSVNGRGADTIRVPYAQLDGVGSMSDEAEGATVATTTLVDDSEDVVVARKAVRYDLSDLAAATGTAGNIDAARLASMIVAHRQTRVNIDLATAWAGATGAVGTTATALSVTTLYAAQYAAREAMIPSIGGRYIVVLKNKNVNDLITSLRSETGILLERGDAQMFAAAKAEEFAGMLGNSAIFGHDNVTDDATDTTGALLGAGALLFGYADPPLPAAGSGAIAQKFAGLVGFMLERQRVSRDARDEMVGNQWHGITARDERIVPITAAV